MNTIRDILTTAARDHTDAPALRHKTPDGWQAISFGELQARAGRVAALLDRLSIPPSERVAILMENHYRWPEIYLGIAASGRTAVPMDAKLEHEAMFTVLRHSEASAIFADRALTDVLLGGSGTLAHLRHVVIADADHLPEPSAAAAPAYHAYDAAIAAIPREAAAPGERFVPDACRPGDLASIIYTSGTTGEPKGVMLTHANFCANIRALSAIVPIDTSDSFLLVLPLHHAFAFTGNLLLPLACGACINFVESLRTIGDNIRELSPTVILGVPLLFDKLHHRINSQVQGNPVARWMLKLGLKRIVQHKIRAKLGGKVRFCVVGGAPTDPKLVEAFNALGIALIEGYGLTETAPVLTLNPPDAPRAGTVGRALPDIQIRIEAPDANGIGEIVVRGPTVMDGYYRNPDATAAVLRDGWFHTGDLGSVDADGYVTIAGRRKNLIVNREGKNIYPEEIEQHLLASPYLLECIVTGFRPPEESTGERVGVIAVPDMEAIEHWCSTNRQPCTDAAAETLLRDEIKRRSAGLADYKRPRAIRIRTNPFEQTSTGKIRRFQYHIEPEPGNRAD